MRKTAVAVVTSLTCASMAWADTDAPADSESADTETALTLLYGF